MTIDKSLKVRRGMSRVRNVMTRAERLEKLKLSDRWKEGDNVLGLPKVRVLKISMKKKKVKRNTTNLKTKKHLNTKKTQKRKTVRLSLVRRKKNSMSIITKTPKTKKKMKAMSLNTSIKTMMTKTKRKVKTKKNLNVNARTRMKIMKKKAKRKHHATRPQKMTRRRLNKRPPMLSDCSGCGAKRPFSPILRADARTMGREVGFLLHPAHLFLNNPLAHSSKSVLVDFAG